MLKYVAFSTAAKAFSLNTATRGVYRKLGNFALERLRVSAGLPQAYLDRAVRLIGSCDKFDILAPGDRVLELGTGWVHWEATVLRLFYDVEITLYDVCDNRLLGAYLSWLAEFQDCLDSVFAHLPAPRREHARDVAARAMKVDTFDELYAALGFTYVLDPTGRLAGPAPAHYALVVSADVLEHVSSGLFPGYLESMRCCLQPGGWSLHQIDLVDHFYYFDTRCSPKNYYRYTDRTWQRWFESDVQYFNRIQRPTWLELFADAGFELVEENHIAEPLAPLNLSSRYRDLAPADIECMQLLTVHRSPSA